jgi:hypothetical protein
MRLSLTDSFKCRSSFAQSISLVQISCGINILTSTYQLNAIYSLIFGLSEFFDTTGFVFRKISDDDKRVQFLVPTENAITLFDQLSKALYDEKIVASI